MILTIQFAKSSSAYYDLAVEVAARHPSHETRTVGRQTVHEVSPDLLDDREFIKELFGYVKGWRGLVVKMDGEVIRWTDFNSALLCNDFNVRCEYDEVYCRLCIKYLQGVKDLERMT